MRQTGLVFTQELRLERSFSVTRGLGYWVWLPAHREALRLTFDLQRVQVRALQRPACQRRHLVGGIFQRIGDAAAQFIRPLGKTTPDSAHKPQMVLMTAVRSVL